jgi:16S rRNA C967 or C1407 C5-methylase (RsmB/RsmF family)
MENTGIIVANDRNAHRLIPLRANVKRLGVINTITTQYPGQHFPKRCLFDRVLVDVPCSAEGTERVGKQGVPTGRGRPVRKLLAQQRELLLRGFDLLRPGGTLVYSTCTYNPEENESAVHCLLERRPATVQPIGLDLPHSPGLSRWQEKRYDASIHHCWRIYPHQLDTVGFFVAKVAKQT